MSDQILNNIPEVSEELPLSDALVDLEKLQKDSLEHFQKFTNIEPIDIKYVEYHTDEEELEASINFSKKLDILMKKGMNYPSNKHMDIDPEVLFCVENGGNTCYMDSIFIALWLSESHCDSMLIKRLKDERYMYLQQFIKGYFVDRVRTNQNVDADTIYNLMHILLNCGWRNEIEIFQQQDVNEFFTFLMDIFDVTVIELSRFTFTNADNKSEEVIEKMPFIPLSLPNEKKAKIADLLNDWLYHNKAIVSRNINGQIQQVEALVTYGIRNIPEFFVLSINRFSMDEHNRYIRNNCDVMIQKKIKPFKHSGNADSRDIEWKFHAAVCHKGNSPTSGHYYTLMFMADKKNPNEKKWYIFDDQREPGVPSIELVSMEDKYITSKIKK